MLVFRYEMAAKEFTENLCVICQKEFENISEAVQVKTGIPSNLIAFSHLHHHLTILSSSTWKCIDRKHLKQNISHTQPRTPKKLKVRHRVNPFLTLES